MLFFSESLVRVCVFRLLTLLFEELSLIASNQQIYDLCKWKDIVEGNFLVPVNYPFNIIKDSCCEHIAGGVNIYLYGCVILSRFESIGSLSVRRVFVCVWYQIRVLAKNDIMCQTSGNLMPCCVKYTTRSFCY